MGVVLFRLPPKIVQFFCSNSAKFFVLPAFAVGQPQYSILRKRKEKRLLIEISADFRVFSLPAAAALLSQLRFWVVFCSNFGVGFKLCCALVFKGVSLLV